ncbi:MAG: dihydroneopterin aldolase [Flavobacteriaceae bacterium]|nr:dihydroneopterin aldolase [Psychroflexus sp.]MDN6311212.1 dihydroneopterin aldolase [Psychroflexus sp.]
MDQIILENVRVYTNHGCLDEEARIGSDYRVDLRIEADLSASAKSDELKDTVDYVHLNKIIKEEMLVRSKLLEHVAQRILNRVFDDLAIVIFAEVKVAKINPPIGGDVEAVRIVMTKSR